MFAETQLRITQRTKKTIKKIELKTIEDKLAKPYDN